MMFVSPLATLVMLVQRRADRGKERQAGTLAELEIARRTGNLCRWVEFRERGRIQTVVALSALQALRRHVPHGADRGHSRAALWTLTLKILFPVPGRP
jgi:hypothetical protein